MSRLHTDEWLILILAHLHRYGAIYPLFILMPIFGEEYPMLVYGSVFVLWAIYTAVGYKMRWKHIFCSFQPMKQKMTPHRIRWHEIKSSDVYGMSAIFGFFGIMAFVLHFITLKM
ncbi:MAG: hypothetical protein IKM61_07785 [Eubacteriaceae bacterium]|nr:hypothetical protein [Eubacteriaceae bacterium]